MSNATSKLEKLSEEVRATKRLLEGLRATGETLLLAEGVSRQLLFAHETGYALLLALRQELVFGTTPLLRNLLEAVVEVFLFVSWPPPGGPSEAAARSAAWDLGQWKRRRELLLETLATAPGALPGTEAAGARSTEEIVEETCQYVEEEGADPTAFREAWEEFSENRPRHWSGLNTFSDRLAFLEEQHPEEERVKLFARRYRFLWGEGSYGSHATPRWDLVKMQRAKDGHFEPYSHESRAQKVSPQAECGVEFLQHLQFLVKTLTHKISE